MVSIIRRSTTIPLVSTSMFVAAASMGLLLDDYPSALAAYSFRKLRTAYAGSACRILFSGDSHQADYGFVGNDFDAAAVAADLITHGGVAQVVTWYDQSSSGYDVAGGINYTASGIGSKPGMINGLGALTTGANVVVFAGTVISCSAVLRYANTSSVYGRVVSIRYNGGDDYSAPGVIPLIRANATDAIEGYSGGVDLSNVAVVNGTAYAFMSIYDGTNHTMYKNGSAGTPVACTSSIGGALGSAIRVGADVGGASWQDLFSEIVFWPSNMTASVAGIDANQSAYYGV